MTLDFYPNHNQAPKSPVINILWWVCLPALFLLAILSALGLYLNQPPQNFLAPKTITIEPGLPGAAIAAHLAKEDIVRSATLFYFILLMGYDPTKIKASNYEFTEPLTTNEVAKRLMAGDFTTNLLKVTFPEGFRVSEYHRFTEDILGNVPPTTTSELEGKEGALFPDTYFVSKSFTHQQLIELMEKMAQAVLREEYDAATGTNLSQEEVIVLASIIEREANDPTAMGLVAGILHKRLELGMPLQVDASVAYGLGKPGTDLTRVDLETDGPYNTYIRVGLPPGPIANPGRVAIKAALGPTLSSYLYYITGRDGNFYYAETLSEHNQNIATHLR